MPFQDLSCTVSKLPRKTEMSTICDRRNKLVNSLPVSGHLQENIYVTKEQATISIYKEQDDGKK